MPSTNWNKPTHDAQRYGTGILKGIFADNRFSFPKSLYAVHDVVKCFVADKPDALIVDFFAGSGTTLHAVNLLNAEDGGRRRCILVTNNEISEAERKDFLARGVRPGSDEWEGRGIARHVTWPRTVCSIEGRDVNGAPLKGEYLGSGRKMADGFEANAAFFSLGFLDKTRVSLGRQLRELLPLLWLKAGAKGPPPAAGMSGEMALFEGNGFAVLADEGRFPAFAEALAAHPGIGTVFLVTDYADAFASMAAALPGRECVQLYRDYLDNFRINAGKDAR